MPHWTQPGLLPRDPQRGDRFENLCFYGHPKNLARELQSVEWRQRLQNELGIQFHLQPIDQWHDYSQTDCVIAIRDFSTSPHWNKPATKLYNAWLAGVPFIGGSDSAYAADGIAGLDYLVATSPEETFEHLRHLKENKSLRAQLVSHGHIAAEEFSREAILQRWKSFIEKTAPSLAHQWAEKRARQRSLFARRQKRKLFLERYCWDNIFNSPPPLPLEINFHINKEYLPGPEWLKAWEEEKLVSLEEPGKCVTTHSWIYQTWSRLRKSGIHCHLIHNIPLSGIFISFGLQSIPASQLLNSRNLFLVDIVAHGNPHPHAHFHIVHNKRHARQLPRSLFMPHWPQPYLTPRDPKRGDLFENICFLGDPRQLAPEFTSPSWSERLESELQLHFQIRNSDRWHDYSDVDAVLAIRDVDASNCYLNKPATKLYNAWHAGVPFIGGIDSAYAEDGRPGIDYLVATSVEEAFQKLRQLKENRWLRYQLVAHGSEAGKEFTREATLLKWQTFVLTTLPKLAKQWQKKSVLQRDLFMVMQHRFSFLNFLFR
jgi:hypothetical protein